MSDDIVVYFDAPLINSLSALAAAGRRAPPSFEGRTRAALHIRLMIHPRAKSTNRVEAKDLLNALCFCVPAQHYSHLGRDKSKTRKYSKQQQPPGCSRHRRKPDPFVARVKEVEDPDAALSLFHEYRRMGFRHDYPSYSALVYKLARSRSFEAVEEILGRIEENDVRCRESLFVALIRHYGKVHLVDEAVRLFQRMTSFNCTRTLQSFNTILNVLVEND
ncbi:hypothetical protein NL676_008496 [Syzygium grande]|nr:hypothetical protein NL676_008496 [Syzygium grande]